MGLNMIKCDEIVFFVMCKFYDLFLGKLRLNFINLIWEFNFIL